MLFKGSPTLQLGIFNVGTKNNVTNQNVVFVVIGKTIPGIGRISAGPYIGNKKVLIDKNGDKENTGVMIAFDRGFMQVKDKDKVFLTNSEQHDFFQVFSDGQELSHGLNVVLGSRSSGKTFLLNKLQSIFDEDGNQVKYIKQF